MKFFVHKTGADWQAAQEGQARIQANAYSKDSTKILRAGPGNVPQAEPSYILVAAEIMV
ncbi:hypothetical protein [Niabella aquatica]